MDNLVGKLGGTYFPPGKTLGVLQNTAQHGNAVGMTERYIGLESRDFL